MADLKPIILWGFPSGPNSWKVAILLTELGLAFEEKFLQLAEMKQEPYLQLNPNGRVPTIQDPNTGVTVFEVRDVLIQPVLKRP
jgi:glutathione S-transferase